MDPGSPTPPSTCLHRQGARLTTHLASQLSRSPCCLLLSVAPTGCGLPAGDQPHTIDVRHMNVRNVHHYRQVADIAGLWTQHSPRRGRPRRAYGVLTSPWWQRCMWGRWQQHLEAKGNFISATERLVDSPPNSHAEAALTPNVMVSGGRVLRDEHLDDVMWVGPPRWNWGP